MDRRQRKTREAIFNAFTDLLSIKSVNKITVGEIIEKADVGRATFYAHFETKDYLLEELCKELFCHVFDSTEGVSKTHRHIFECDICDSPFYHLLMHIKNNDNRILDLFSCDNNEMFLRYFKNGVLILVNSQYEMFESKYDNLPQDFVVNHIASSFVETVRWWIENGLKQSPEEINRYFLNAIS